MNAEKLLMDNLPEALTDVSPERSTWALIATGSHENLQQWALKVMPTVLHTRGQSLWLLLHVPADKVLDPVLDAIAAAKDCDVTLQLRCKTSAPPIESGMQELDIRFPVLCLNQAGDKWEDQS